MKKKFVNFSKLEQLKKADLEKVKGGRIDISKPMYGIQPPVICYGVPPNDPFDPFNPYPVETC